MLKKARKARLLAMLLLISTLLTMAYAALAEPANELTPEQLAEIIAALEDEQKMLPIDERFRLKIDERDLSITPGLDEAWLNILLLGTDTGDMRLNYGRTDAMMVLSVNADSGEMKLTSLVRDMYVDIPDMKLQNRINTANAFGGPLLAVKTVNEVLGLNIRHYCSINFKGFEEIIDYLGGVTIALSGGEASLVGARGTREPQLLNGKQALDFVRIRQLDNNFGRNERQRRLLTAVLEQVRSSAYDQVMNAVTAGFKAIATNLSAGDVISLLPVVLRNTGEMATLSLPQEGQYHHKTTEAGASVVVFEAEPTRSAFHQFVYGKGE